MDATVILDGGIEQGNVPLDGTGHGLAVMLPERGTALDVGEEEGDGTGGKVWHDPLEGCGLLCFWRLSHVSPAINPEAYRLVIAMTRAEGTGRTGCPAVHG
jgi:hypothetical protein